MWVSMQPSLWILNNKMLFLDTSLLMTALLSYLLKTLLPHSFLPPLWSQLERYTYAHINLKLLTLKLTLVYIWMLAISTYSFLIQSTSFNSQIFFNHKLYFGIALTWGTFLLHYWITKPDFLKAHLRRGEDISAFLW